MKSSDFERVYKKSIKLYSLYFKHDFKANDYLVDLCTKNLLVSNNKKIIEDSIIEKKNINIDNFVFVIYKFKINHLSPIEVDDDYNILPQEEIILYEGGLCLSYVNENGELFEINGIFELCDENIDVINNKYLYLIKLIESNDLDLIMHEIESYIDNKIKYFEDILM